MSTIKDLFSKTVPKLSNKKTSDINNNDNEINNKKVIQKRPSNILGRKRKRKRISEAFENEEEQFEDFVQPPPIICSDEVIENIKDKECVLGIDEAGRGPVLGPMTYGCAFWPIDKQSELIKIGFDDSKILNDMTRKILFKIIIKSKEIGYYVDIIPASTISAKMQRINQINLNKMSHNSAIHLIQTILDKGVNLKKIFVDTVGQPAKYQTLLSNLFPDIDITVSKKADSLYPIVSAASICAKVTRDYHVHNWKFIEEIYISKQQEQQEEIHEPCKKKIKLSEESSSVNDSDSTKDNNNDNNNDTVTKQLFNTNFGSGYPGDRNTVNWLKNNLDPVFGYPTFVRFSWDTTKTILKNNCVNVNWSYEDSILLEESENPNKRNRNKLQSSPGVKRAKNYKDLYKKNKRFFFFSDRHLFPVNSL